MYLFILRHRQNVITLPQTEWVSIICYGIPINTAWLVKLGFSHCYIGKQRFYASITCHSLNIQRKTRDHGSSRRSPDAFRRCKVLRRSSLKIRTGPLHLSVWLFEISWKIFPSRVQVRRWLYPVHTRSSRSSLTMRTWQGRISWRICPLCMRSLN